jgi:hypothetical protein
VLQNRFRNGVWQGWKPVAGLQSDRSPTLAFNPKGSVTELYVVGTDRQVRHSRRLDDIWSTPVALGATTAFPVAATARPDGRVEVVITDQAGNLQHNRFEATVTVPEVSFANEIQPLFNASCRCHTGSAPPEGMNLGPGKAIANITSVRSRQSSLDRIEPGDPARSYLWHKIKGTQRTVGGTGSRMPLGGRLSDAQIEKIRQWIVQGAKNT